MGNSTASKKVMYFILGSFLFMATVLISQFFDPYSDLIALGSEGSDISDILESVRLRYVFSEAYAFLEISSAVDGLENLPSFQEFPICNILWILLMGSFFFMLSLWNLFENDFFDTDDCNNLPGRILTWITHYFASFVVTFWISVAALECTRFVSWILCALCRVHMALGVVFLLVLAFPLIFLYIFCFIKAIFLLKYFIVCVIPIGILSYLNWFDPLFVQDLNLETIMRQPLIPLGLLALLIYERVCVQILMTGND